MPKSDHFIYTAAKIGNTEGYQIIGKSAGITDEIISNFSEYFYPLGVKVSDFIESRSLLFLPNDKISYSIIKNVGIGYDGRRGTLYNHTFVMDRKDFKKLDFDSRVFEKYFIRNDSFREELKPIEIEPISISPDFDLLRKLDPKLLEEILLSLFGRKKIALVKTDELKLPQNLLSILPPSLRLVQFSTLVVEPDRQYQFELIQIPERSQSKVEKDFTIINPNSLPVIRKKSIYDDSVEELVHIVLNKNEKLLQQVFKNFEKIAIQVSQVKKVTLKQIFNQKEFENLSQKKNFDKLKQRIQNLYSSKIFTQAPPKVVASITRKLRKIIERALKRQKKSKARNENDLNQLLFITKTLLDCMYYMRDYSPKPILKSIRNDISIEISQLEEMMKEYRPPESIKPYAFDLYEYVRMVFEQTAKLWALPFVLLSKK